MSAYTTTNRRTISALFLLLAPVMAQPPPQSAPERSSGWVYSANAVVCRALLPIIVELLVKPSTFTPIRVQTERKQRYVLELKHVNHTNSSKHLSVAQRDPVDS